MAFVAPALPYIYAATMAATAYSGYETYQAARSEAAMTESVARYNADVDKAKARQMDLDAQENQRRQRKEGEIYKAKQRSALAAAGVLPTGSSLDLLATTAGEIELRQQDSWRETNLGMESLYSAAKVGILEGGAEATGIRRRGVASLFSTGAHLLGETYSGVESGVFGG
jgi:hypothetical protein